MCSLLFFAHTLTIAILNLAINPMVTAKFTQKIVTMEILAPKILAPMEFALTLP